jgi:hypothetical protein
MAENTNALAAFYADGTYKLVLWKNARELHDPKRYVAVAAYHVQQSSTPAHVVFNGHDVVGVRIADDALMVRQADFPPWPTYLKESCFYNGGSQSISLEIPGPLEMVLAGAEAVLYTKDYEDLDYDEMTNRANAKAAELVAAPVPSAGTY